MLKYVGQTNSKGERSFLPGIPARDLTDEDIRELKLNKQELVKSGLYQIVGEKKPEKAEA